MLILSLPKGIMAFVTVVAGLSVSLPLSVLLVGLPLLAETCVLCAHMMASERWTVDRWMRGEKLSGEDRSSERPVKMKWEGWRALLAVLVQGRSYRGILYGFLQFPIGIAAFTLAIVLPVTSWAVMLSPLAYQISLRVFSFELFAYPDAMGWLLPTWSGYERSWLAGGIGAVFVLLMPLVLRALGRMYAGWITAVAGPESVVPPAVSAAVSLEERAAVAKMPEPEPYA